MPINPLIPINSLDYSSFVQPGLVTGQEAFFSIYDPNKTVPVDNTGVAVENTSKSDMGLIAHRGYSVEAPENTIPAFEAAAEKGFSTVECDIEWSKDGVPVILHDPTINRTARHKNGWNLLFTWKCSDLTYDELSKLDFGIWKGKKYKGTKIPTFSEFMDCCKDNNLNAYIEIKTSDKFDLEKAKKLVDTVKQAGLEDKVTWISFNADYLKMISQVMPDCRLGYLSSDSPSEETIETLKSLKTENNEVFLDVKSTVMNVVSSQLLHDSGFEFESWTVDSGEELDRLQSCDCQAITTNCLTETIPD